MCSWKHGELSLPPSVPSNEGQKRYRVTHLLEDLGWVDWIWDVPQEMSARRWVTLYNIAPKIAFYGRTVGESYQAYVQHAFASAMAFRNCDNIKTRKCCHIERFVQISYILDSKGVWTDCLCRKI